MNSVMSYPGIIVEMMEEYYESGRDFDEVKYDHARYFIGKNYYLYRDLVSKDLSFYEMNFVFDDHKRRVQRQNSYK